MVGHAIVHLDPLRSPSVDVVLVPDPPSPPDLPHPHRKNLHLLTYSCVPVPTRGGNDGRVPDGASPLLVLAQQLSLDNSLPQHHEFRPLPGRSLYDSSLDCCSSSWGSLRSLAVQDRQACEGVAGGREMGIECWAKHSLDSSFGIQVLSLSPIS